MKKISLMLFSTLLLFSCGNDTEVDSKVELEKIKLYTEQKPHDSALIGEWVFDGIFETFSKTGTIHIAFRENGKMDSKQFADGEQMHDWVMLYYYYTEDNKLYFYRPGENSFLMSEGEYQAVESYVISQDRLTLTITDSNNFEKVYHKKVQ